MPPSIRSASRSILHASHRQPSIGLIVSARQVKQSSSDGEDWVVFSWACRGAEGLRVVTPVHVDPRSSDSDSSSTAKNVYIPLISLAWTP